jgi:hypothetical protein
LKARPIFSAATVAAIYTALGNKEKAFEWLNKSYEERTAAAPALKLDPGWDPLRSDPRFNDLLRRMNLQPLISSFRSDHVCDFLGKAQKPGSTIWPKK